MQPFKYNLLNVYVNCHVFYFSCPASPAVKVYPSAFDEVRFSVRAFEFRTSPGGIVYIHCQVSVCSPTSPQCRVGCAHRHRREVSTEDGGSHLVSGGPYLLVADKGMQFIRERQLTFIRQFNVFFSKTNILISNMLKHNSLGQANDKINMLNTFLPIP